MTFASAAENLSMFDPASPPALAIRSLTFFVLAITGAIFLVVEGMLLYCLLRFRRKDPSDTKEPPQIYGSQPIEVAWTLAPLLIVFVLFLVVVRTVIEVRHDQPLQDALQITVVGHQWWWEYRFLKEGSITEEFVTANELHVPVDKRVFLRLESADVVHSYWVPRLAGKTDVVPGKINTMWFQANEAGTYLGQCAEYCGTQHAQMLLRVIAEPEKQFEAWAARQKKKVWEDMPSPAPAAVAGKERFLSLNCVSCHRVRGTPAAGTFGPDLTHLMSRETLAARTIPNDQANLIQWITDPNVLKPGCNMPNLHLSKSEVDEVVAFLKSLR